SMVPVDLTLMVDLGMILLAATFFSYLAKIFKQPPLLAFIVAGLFLGPFALGSLGLSIPSPIGEIPIGIQEIGTQILILSEIGVALLLFSVGVESDFSKLAEMGKVVLFGGILQFLLTILFVIITTVLTGLLPIETALLLGVILSFSATTIVVKILSDKHLINSLQGRLMIGFLLVQDLLVILAIPFFSKLEPGAALTSLLEPNSLMLMFLSVVVLIALAYILNKFIYRPLFKLAIESSELLFLAGMSSCFLFIILAYVLNFPIAIGAFIAGISLSTLPYNLEVYNKVRGTRDLFATIFFVTLGLQITPGFLGISLPIILVILGTVFILKPLTFYLITLFSGYGGRIAMLVGLGLAQVSEFSFILASATFLVLEQTPGLYSFILFTITLSMVITPYIMDHSSRLYQFLDRIILRFFPGLKTHSRFHWRIKKLDRLPSKVSKHIVVVGAGTMGFSVAEALKDNYSIVVVDHDSEAVFNCIDHKIHALYGSVDNEEIWERLNLPEAKLLILATPDVENSIPLAHYAKKVNPKIVIFGRAHYYRDALTLYEEGVDFVVMPLVIGSNVFLEKVADFLEKGNLSSLESFKDEFIIYLKEKVEEEHNRLKM
ncbi:MAG: cation:proton antiporter, partial [Candidatus Diapherotrites archaeon]